MSDREACLYLVSRYPGVTHTFIVDEVRALRTVGVRVETASVRRVRTEEVLSEVDRAEHQSTHAILPATPGDILRSHGRAFLRSPRAYVRTFARALRLSHAGGRPRLWQAFYFGEALLLWDWLRQRDIRHIHVHHANVSADLALLACAYANAGGTEPRWTWSLTIHGPTELVDVATHKLAVKVADASAVICTSDYARSQVSALAAPEDLAKVHTVRCGVDLDAFRPGFRAAERGGHCEVLCVAAMSRRKGHRVLLEAFTEVLRGEPGARLTLVGDGPERRTLQGLTAELELDDVVRFAGPLGHDRVGELYEAADVFCLPSFSEGVPTVLMEAMAMGLPVVATNVMGTAELVEHRRSGLLVLPGRADLLAAALLSMIADPELRRTMGAAGRERVSQDFELHAAVASLREKLSPLMGG